MLKMKFLDSAFPTVTIIENSKKKADGMHGSFPSIHRRCAFTLVELLVVIAIVALLAAMLIPAVTHSKQLSQRIHCVGNLRQIGIAANLYVDSNRGFLPYCENHWISASAAAPFHNYYDPEAPGFRENFYHLLNPYLAGHDGAWKCRAVLFQLSVGNPEYVPGFEGPPIAYMGNEFAIATQGKPPLRSDDLITPSKVKMFLDQGFTLHTVWTRRTYPATAELSYGYTWPIANYFFRTGKAGVNVVHADGHVDFVNGKAYRDGPGNDQDFQYSWWRTGLRPEG